MASLHTSIWHFVLTLQKRGGWEGGLKMFPCLGALEFPAKIPMALIELEVVCKSAISVRSPRFEKNAVTYVGGEIKKLIRRQREKKKKKN